MIFHVLTVVYGFTMLNRPADAALKSWCAGDIGLVVVYSVKLVLETLRLTALLYI
jgi:hypothetical protein